VRQITIDPSNATSALAYEFEVTMHRKENINAYQSARKCIAYVRAANAAEALAVAEMQAGKAAFKSISAKRVS